MNKLLFSFLLIITIGFISCETDIDVNAEYKDIPVVYAIINPADTTKSIEANPDYPNHYIKINKAFLGDASALDLAADANNFNYNDGDLDVTIEEIDASGAVVNSYLLTRTVNEIPKDQGIFDNSTNVLYKFIEPNINRDNTYRLNIYNTVLDKEITAETEIVNEIIVSDPVNTGQKFSFWIGTLAGGNENAKTIKVTTKPDVGRVSAKFIFNYYDVYKLSSGKDSVARSVVMPLGETITTTSLGEESLEWEIKGGTFFENVASAVPDMPTDLSHRRLNNISLEFAVAGTDLNTYMQVNAPSTSVNQDKPSYTNVTNGLGVFSSRDKIVWKSSIDPILSNQVNIQNATITYLATHTTLSAKGFCFGSIGTGFPVAPCVQLP
jgi:hypothetical protein